MRKTKSILMAILTILLSTISTLVFAYNGTDEVDIKYEITMPSTLTEGKGTVVTSVSGNFKYQFVETTKEKFDKLNKLAAQLKLMQAFVTAEKANWEDNQLNEAYDALVKQYKSTYNEQVSSLYNTYGSIDENSISDVRSLWIHELPNYVSENWVNATDKQVSLDLSTFEGTKYYVAWVQIGDMYDAEVYMVNGTKTTEPEQKDPEQNEPEKEEPKKEEPKQEEPKKDEPKQEEPKQEKPGDTTTAPQKTLPHTGIVENLIMYVGITMSAVVAIISYRKLKNIK